MEVKPGYKQTEVGVIPEEWDAVPLGRMIKLQGGCAFRSNDFSDIGVPVIRISDIQNGTVRVDGAICHPPIPLPEDFVVRQGDILVAMSGATTGKVGLFQHSKPAYQNQRVGKFVVRDKKRTSQGFIEQLVRSSIFVSRLGVFLEQGAQPNISGHQIESLVFAAPRELSEQNAIAGALSDVDALLGALDRLIAKKRDLKQAAMQQLLTGQTRLPGFHGEWEVKRIGEFTDCTAGGTPSTLIRSYWGGSIRWMNSGELNLKFVGEVEGRITEEGLRNSSTKIIPPKCVLVGLAGQGKTRGTVAMNLVELCTNQSIAAIFPSDAFVPEYLYYNLDTRYDELRDLSSGDGGRGGLNLTIIKAIRVQLPTIPEQTAIAEVLSDLDAELAALEQRRAKTRALKQGLMQELLTGRTRLV